MDTITLHDLATITGGKRYQLLPRSGVYFTETPAEHACLNKASAPGTQLTDREVGLKCGFSAARATAYSNAVQRAEDAIDP